MSEVPNLPPGYPVEWEADVVLRDGSVAHLRPIVPDDADALRRFHAGQSDESIYLRFFAPLKELSDRDVFRFTHVDYLDRVALVATVGDDIIGVGRYDLVDSTTAEVAFNISDHFQGRGIGSILLEHLAAIAFEQDVTRFLAEVLPQNRKMLNVFREAGYEVSHKFEDGVVAVSFDIRPTAASQEVRLAREHRAESVSMRRVLFPTSVAVIGASRDPDRLGHRVLKNLLDAGFTGPVYAVNQEADKILGLRCYPKIGDVPGQVDLAMIALRADQVLAAAKECGKAGVHTLLVFSSGFAEAGADGEIKQDKLRRRARKWGMRVIGPSSFGVINTHPDVRLNGSLAPELPRHGGFGLFSQSGALGVAVLASARRRGIGLSVFASAGNRVDVSGNDLMQYWIDDPQTTAVGLYVESMGNPRKFSRIARHLASIKPVIVVKSGVSSYGAPPGHRTRQTQMPPEAFDAMLGQAGVIRVGDAHELFDIAQLVTTQPLPRGHRLAVLGNADSLGAITAETALSEGLEVTRGPVILSNEASADDVRDAMRSALADPEVDSVATCFVPPLIAWDADVVAAIREEAALCDKPVVATFLGMHGVVDSAVDPSSVAGQRGTIPAYTLPEDAVRALAAVTKYAKWRERDRGVEVSPAGIDQAAAQALVDRVLDDEPGGRALSQEEAAELLGAYGIALWPQISVTTEEEAVAAGRQIGFPVILKSRSPLVRHTQGVTGLRTDLQSEEAVRLAYQSLVERLGDETAHGFAVQQMATPGVSCVVGGVEDPLFGPVVSFSIAGPPTELLGDIAYRIPPLTDVDVLDLITTVRAAPLLTGHRGRVPVHQAALADLVARVGVLTDDLPEIVEVKLLPVNAWSGGVDVLGAEVRVAPTSLRLEASRRALV
jgi:acyl-CoA synthetase (NDP forming)/GNAT superfamily N-acetyltransferase